MKEFSIEEKARAYDEAFEKARQLCAYPTTKPFISDLQDIFPELKESEDEKIRKWIRKELESKYVVDNIVNNEMADKALAWLEKQGECHISHDDEIMIEQLIEHFTTGHGLQNTNETVVAWFNDVKRKLEKQGETFTKKDVDDAYLKGVTDTKNEIEKQYEETYQIRKDIATFIFNYRGVIKDRAKWMDYLGIKVFFVEKQSKQKPDTDFSDLRTWKYIVDAVWTEKEGIGQYLDSPFTEEVAKKLQKRFGNIEQKPADKIQLGKKYKCIASPRYTAFMKGLVYEPKDKFLCSLMNFCSDCFEPIEYVEQKPADKVEPKFHEGNWITDGTSVFQIVKIEGEWYYADDGDKICFDVVHQYYHLWTINDAKDGDVLTTDTWTFIFKKYQDGSVHYHCAVSTFNNFSISDTGIFDSNYVHPATKEQRDLLFQKMHEAGYEWDAEKKELKKIEQNIAEWSEDKSKELSLSLQIQSYLNTASDELYAKGKPLYSEKRIEDIHKCMLMWKKLHDSYFHRIYTWSEKDEIMFKNTIALIETLEDYNKAPNGFGDVKIWLKSLKERYTWKPSDVQMEALESATENCAYSEYQDCLRELIEQLKKL